MDDGSGAGPRDWISALPDELLHVILSFVDDARDIMRTAVLSRRWRHMWVHAKNLNFCSLNLKNCTAPGGFPGFVDWVLAHRAETTMDSLVIWMTQKSRAASPEQIDAWLRYAVRHVLKSLRVQLVGEQKDHKAVVVLLPSICRTSYISLSLSTNMSILQLPALATANYEALTELYLHSPSFSEQGPVLGDFVTSCCHSLRRLSISAPKALFQLVLRSEELQQLEIYWAFDLRTLDVTAPNLRVHSMFVTAISGFPARHLVSSVASLLIRCSRHLRLLRLSIPVFTPRRDIAKCFCDNLEDKWEIPGKIALE
ncbi:hypothetical protein PR202_gb06617 [Eleusine coracana subsp. coracana]|uniref:F-box domain-containing protein n=1 Tax=Eleusine coracana subsp. coracana TaxID=191504 RepID=A0AAV5EA36_ELECO|nr:hypothetical protein QOZ80_2BG0159870 [Eleusine coracana subsp. coracana]GJN19350.1 hypothetical protein PR202_gb06617 [Eleusine coracana subsp. coracana]